MARGYPDFEGGKSGVYLKPEWAAKEGVDKNFTRASGVQKAWGQEDFLTYTVPAGKTLYIVQASLSVSAVFEADADNNQLADFEVGIFGVRTLAHFAALGGGTIVFPKPQVIEAGQVFRVNSRCRSNHKVVLVFSVTGYEV